MPFLMSVAPVATQIRIRLSAPESSALQNREHPRQRGSIDAGIDNHPAIHANDDHHLPARRCGSNRRLDLSGKDDPRKAGFLASRANQGSGPNERRHVISNERDMPWRTLAVEDIARGA